jgi:hypothetical protein
MTIRLNNLAHELHTFCCRNYLWLSSVTSWMEFQELRDRIGGEWVDFSQPKMLRIMKRGVELGLFSKSRWAGVGLTPFAGSARRARMWDVLRDKAKP